MTAQVKYFNSRIHTGLSTWSAETAGSLLAQIKLCMTTGFNAVTVNSITRATTVATVTTASAHNYIVGQVILLAGATPSDYNGEWVVATVPTSTTFTFTIATTPGSTSVQPTCKVAPLGWDNPFTGTNKDVFRSPNVLSTQKYFRLNDPATFSCDFNINGYPAVGSVGKFLQVSMYDTMSSVDVGPLELGRTHIMKSRSNQTTWTAQPFIIIGDDTFVHIWVPAQVTAVGTQTSFTRTAFGDIEKPYLANDAWRACIYGGTIGGHSLGEEPYQRYLGAYLQGSPAFSTSNTINGMFARDIWGVNPRSLAAQGGPSLGPGVGTSYGLGVTYPMGPDCSARAYPVISMQAGGIWRGPIPGLYNTGFYGSSFYGYDSMPGFTIAGEVGARELMLIREVDTGSATVGCGVDITGPWR